MGIPAGTWLLMALQLLRTSFATSATFVAFAGRHLGRPATPITGAPMRISISHHDVRKGLLFRKTMHEVHLSVAFTYEEKQIVRQRRLGDQVILQRRPANAKVDDRDDKFLLRLGDLLDGRTDRFLLATPSAAKIYEEDLIRMLAQVKLWISDNAETAGRTVIEL